MSTTKIGENTSNISKLLFFTLNLNFAGSNQISTYRKLHLPLTSSIYFVFLPLEMQKRLKQTKVCHAFSYFVSKETTHKPLKVAAAKSLLSSVYIIGTTCFDECFSFYVITKRYYFLSCFVKLFFWAPFCYLPWSQCFERSPYFMRYLHSNNMMLIPKFQNKADYAS